MRHRESREESGVSSNDVSRAEKALDAVSTSELYPQGEYSILDDPGRITVQFAMSIHNASASKQSDEARFHLVLKFFYPKTAMKYFVDEKQIPKDDVPFLKEFGSNRRFFPFLLINSVAQKPINWSYHNKQGKGQIYERIELFTTMSEVKFDRYYPFVLNLINFKIGTDESRQCGLINLVPKPQSEANPTPALDLGVFMRDTSVFTMQETKTGELQYEVNAMHSDAYCKMTVPQWNRLSDADSDDGVQGIATRIYLCLFFESSWSAAFDLFRFQLVSSILLLLFVFTHDLELGDMMEVNVALILTDIALVWVLESSDEFTTTERVLILHTLSMLLITIIEASETSGFNVIAFVIVMLFVTVCFGIWEYSLYWRLVRDLKQGFYNNNRREASFQVIDRII